MKKILLPIVLFLSIFTYQITSAVSNPLDNPLINISDFNYKGAFVPSGDNGSGSLASSLGRMAVDPDNNSIFLSGHRTNGDGIGEYMIPELKIENDHALLNKGNQIQDLTSFLGKILNTEGHNEIGGIQVMSGALVVNSYEYYDGAAGNIKTTSIFRDKSDLGNSLIDGIFGINGKAHMVLWLSKIPLEWQILLGGDYIGGGSNAIPINGRSSMGPSAFSFSGSELLNNVDTGVIIPSNKLLDFSLLHILAGTLLGWINLSGWGDGLQYNYAVTIPQATDYSNNYDIGLVGTGTLWTEASSAYFGFIVPGTRTYATIGSSGMHNSGGGYKIINKDGTPCPGSCSYDPIDNYNYIWLWDLADLVYVEKGIKLSHEVKPYEYGEFSTPYEFRIDGKTKNLIGGGDFDYINNILYLTLPSAYKKTAYSQTPIILAYDISVPVQTEDPGEYFVTHMENIPNPVYNSTFRVSETCKGQTLCNWEDTTTWSEGVLPGLETKVIIDGKVQINNTGSIAKHVVIYPDGELYFNPNVDTKLFTGDLIVGPDGYLEIGTETTPVNGNVTAEVVIRDFAFEPIDVKQHLRTFLSQDGKVRIHGEEKSEVFVKLSKEIYIGENQVELQQSAHDMGWKVGDLINIPHSTQCTLGGTECRLEGSQTEEFNIIGISTDGLTITFSGSFVNDHLGARNADGTMKFFPYVINKQRNVIFRSENPNGIRGHSLFHSKSDIDIRYASFIEMGRTNTDYVGSYQNIKARYPIHAHHLIGPDTPQSNGYQFTLLGNVIDFGVDNVNLKKKWGLVIHGSHYGLIEKNILDRASGAGIVTEDGSETGNMFRKNFVVRMVYGNGERTEDRNDKNFYSDNEVGFDDRSKLGRAGSAFWFNGGGGNFYEGNIVADMMIGKIYTHAFKFDNIYTGNVRIPTKQGDNPHMMGEYIEKPSYNIGITYFKNNEAYAVQSGLTYWWYCSRGSEEDGIYAVGCENKFEDFSIWNFFDSGLYGYPAINTTITNFTARGEVVYRYGNYKGANKAITFGDYMAKNLLIENADIYGVKVGIDIPSNLGGKKGDILKLHTGSIMSIKNSSICSTTPLLNQIIWSVGDGNNLSSKRLVLDNVLTCDEGTYFKGKDLYMKQSGRGNDYNDNYLGRNEVIWKNYSYSGTTHDLFIIPNYQDDSYCNSALANCSENVSSDFPLIELGKVYRLNPTPEQEPQICTSFTYSDWGVCSSENTQARIILTSLPGSCTGGTPESLVQSCSYVAPEQEPQICTSFTYSDWGVCSSENTQARIILTSLPGSCTGGTPESLAQSCSYVAPVVKRSGGGGGGGGGSRAKTCLDTQLECRQVKGSKTLFKLYRKVGVSCVRGNIGKICDLKDNIKVNSVVNKTQLNTKTQSNIKYENRHYSENKIISKFEKRIDKKIDNIINGDIDVAVKYRNKVVKSLESYLNILKGDGIKIIKKIKLKILKRNILNSYKKMKSEFK